ncbi:hypothetical protein CXP43_16195 [Bacillus velezensis]|uniref:hypothetical protein n=1 Tax=Bacillus velezensis TaxID=492670 RepID=UPI000C6DD1F9|nr:hypothetical protein [Bacillus velezensis]AUG37176.1 hypothetical protein CXP43_16195 [Bacillus velezensis]QRL10375.1 hypothetical protein GKO36_16155 [Bacillus velezensis]
MAKLDGVKTLDMVNGEITKVAYGGAEYERVEGEAKVGDIVFVTESWGDQNIGEFFVVTYTTSGIRDQIVGMDGNICEASTYRHNLRIFRKVSAVNVEAERLRVGDYAKVVGQAIVTEKGDIVKVIQDTGCQVPFMVETMDGKDTEWRTEESLVRATDEEVAEAKDAAARAKFKEGAKVRLKSGGGDYPLGGFTDGNIYEVSDNAYNHRRGTLIRIEGGDCFRGSGFAAPDQLEILTEEKAAEIERQQAEEAKWAKIGRKVGEYKNGDVVRYDYGDNEICEVVDDTEEGRVGVQTKEYGICREKPANLRLITPVEARFDR